MFIFGNLLGAFAVVLNVALSILWWLIFIRAIISWVNPDPYNPIVQFLHRSTEPFLSPIRRIIPPYNIGLDLSPLVAILIIIFVQNFVVGTLVEISYRMR